MLRSISPPEIRISESGQLSKLYHLDERNHFVVIRLFVQLVWLLQLVRHENLRWLDLPISKIEQFRVQSNLDTLVFAQSQLFKILESLTNLAAKIAAVQF